jgi:hypothetical protein
MYHGQGQCGKGHFDQTEVRGNMFGPSRSTCNKYQAGYTVKSGMVKELMLSFLVICQSSQVPTLVENEKVVVYPCVIENDGTALKAGLRFDERSKVVVGLTETCDIKFVEENPHPASKFLKKTVVTEAIVSFVSTLDNVISMPVGIRYVAKSGKTGENMRAMFIKDVEIMQMCKQCVTKANAEQHIMPNTHEHCNSLCENCWDLKTVCDACKCKGQISHIPGLRACIKCLEVGTTCEKCLVLVYTTDCEEGNKKAIET